LPPKEAAAIKESETANLQAVKTAQEQGLEVAPVNEASMSDLPKPYGFEADVQVKAYAGKFYTQGRAVTP